ncbi:uncharacterized protein TA14500 [Theileria annulata]|uniref:Gamma tubulin complex component protein N-terminal domain-containing protein n=1 Tax=Theileria annulata TaxID=5874 RepID=Q4UF31_THEAN|nr:uncharacterized protein TA14500 [Theileria annulata]CAI74308.1 hypothetical protein TA14500 [Theileria annulata]|eukprot:XP_952040.1 hypothetical protein TA14500 [Theileria annulata]
MSLFESFEIFCPEFVDSGHHFGLFDRKYLELITKTGHLYKKLRNFCENIPNPDYASELSNIFTNNGKFTTDFEPESLEFFSTNTHIHGLIENTDSFMENCITLHNINEFKPSPYYLCCFANSMNSHLNKYRNYFNSLRNLTHLSVQVSCVSKFTEKLFKLLQLLNNVIVQFEYKSLEYKDGFPKFKCLLEILDQDYPDEFNNIVNSKLRDDLLELFRTQLTYWLIYGKLIDPFGEFIISSSECEKSDLKSKSASIFISELLNFKPNNSSSECNHFLTISNLVYSSRISDNATFGPVDHNTANTILMIGKLVPILNCISANSSINKVLKKLADDCLFKNWNEVTSDNEKFSSAIENYRLQFSTILWDTYNPKYNILNKIKLLKSVYLLLEKPIYDQLFEQSYDIMSMNFGENELKTVNKSFTTLINRLKDDMDGGLSPENENLDNFKFMKFTNQFDINSSFKLINDIELNEGSYEVGNESSIWYPELIYVMNGFNMNIVVDLQLVNQSKEFSLVISPKISHSANGRSFNDHRTLNCKCLLINFRVIHSNFANLTFSIDIVLNHNPSDCENKFTRSLISRIEKVVEYKESNLKLGIEMMLKRNSLKVFLKSVPDEFCFLNNYSTQSSNPSNYSNQSNNSNNSNPSGSFDNENVDDLEIAGGVTISTKSSEHEEDLYGLDNNSINLRIEINQENMIELLKLVSEFSYVGIVHHSKDLDYSLSELSIKGISNKIKILSWNYYTINYDTLNCAQKINLNNSSEVNFNHDFDNWANIILYYNTKDINFINTKPYYQVFQLLFNTKKIMYGLENKFLTDFKIRTRYTECENNLKYSDHMLLVRKTFAFKHFLHSRLSRLLSSLYSLVIVPSYLELESFMNNSNDFLKIIHKHDEYITKIQRLFVSNENVVSSYIQCLNVCLRFIMTFDTFKEFLGLSYGEVYEYLYLIDQLRYFSQHYNF